MPNHPSFGPVPPEEFARAAAAPAFTATSILRRYAPSFGLTSDAQEDVVKDFTVTVTRRVIGRETATVRVKASSKDNAESIVNEMDGESFNWAEDYCNQPDDEFEIDDIEEDV